MNDSDDTKTREMMAKAVEFAQHEARAERDWKIILPEMSAFALLYTWTIIGFPSVLEVSSTGLAYFFVVYAVLAAVRIGLSYPIAYATTYLLILQNKKFSPELSVMVNSIESWMMWPVALVIVAWLSPDNVSYASGLTLFSGALALGIFKGILRLTFGKFETEP